MSTIKYFFTLHFALIIFINFTYAQDCTYCDKALKDSAIDVYSSTSLVSFDEGLKELFSKDYKYWSSADRSKENSNSIRAAYDIFTGMVSSTNKKSMSEKEFNENKEIYIREKSLSSFEAINFYKRVASQTAYQAWENCIKLCLNSGGINLSILGTSNEEFVVRLIFIPRSAAEANLKNLKVTITPLNATYKSGALGTNNATLNPFEGLTGIYARTIKNADVIISITVEGIGAKEHTIPGAEIINPQKFYWDFSLADPQFAPPKPQYSNQPIKSVNFLDNGNGLININTLMKDKEKVAGIVYLAGIITVPDGAKKIKVHNGSGVLTATNVNHDEVLTYDCTTNIQIKYFWNNVTRGNLINNFENQSFANLELTSPDTRACPKHLQESMFTYEIPSGTKEISIIIQLDDDHISRVYFFSLPDLYVQFE